MLVGWLQGKRILDMFTIGVRYFPVHGAGPSLRPVSRSQTRPAGSAPDRTSETSQPLLNWLSQSQTGQLVKVISHQSPGTRPVGCPMLVNWTHTCQLVQPAGLRPVRISEASNPVAEASVV